MVQTGSIQLSSRGNADMKDITDEIQNLIRQSDLTNGTVTVFSPSSTSGITTIEFESGCISDLGRLFDEIAPQNKEYQHHLRWRDGNGHSHVLARASLALFLCRHPS